MIQLILNEDIYARCAQFLKEPEPKIIEKMNAVRSPRKREHLDGIAACAEMFHQHAVVEKTSSNDSQVTVYYQSDSQERSFRKDAQAISFSQIFTVITVIFVALILDERVSQKILDRCSMLGFNP